MKEKVNKIISSMRTDALRVAKFLYHKAPLSEFKKSRLKNVFFKYFGFMLGGTRIYQTWKSINRKSQRLRNIKEQFFSGLPNTDGQWEWNDYFIVRNNIHEKLKTLSSVKTILNFSMIDIGDENPTKAAMRIHLPDPGPHPEVSILLPVFNQIKTTLECLLSIAQNTSSEIIYEIIVADDASTDETRSVLMQIPHLRIKTNPHNLNFLLNCNAALEEIRGEYVLLLNNDTQVLPGWLSSLLTVFKQEKNVGAVGPKLIFPNGTLQEAGVRLKSNGFPKMMGYNDCPDKPRYNYMREVDYCSGACLLLKTEVFKKLGGFDTRFTPAYYEDVDLCLQLKSQGLRILYCPDAVILHHLNKTTNAIGVSHKEKWIKSNNQKFCEKWGATLNKLNDIRIIAFYLPQFHPIPENDLWWGKGFTEWTNVSKAKPNFLGHYQPRRPAELGYYDLRLPQILEEQTKLAKQYGIDAFCFYYYWFAGKRLLEQPLEAILKSDTFNMPFCLCWANENWSKHWDGQNEGILIAQNHSDEDDVMVINDLSRYFKNANYIRVNGKPILLIYRISLFPDFKRTAKIWRETCLSNGIGEIYLVTVESFEINKVNPAHYGCDASVEFPPHNIDAITSKLDIPTPLFNENFQGTRFDYCDAAVAYSTKEYPNYTRFPSVMPGWDNTARQQNKSICFDDATPGAFQAWLEQAIRVSKEQCMGDERLVFINAWNEWAEGAYLEPDARFGHTFLEAVHRAKKNETHLKEL